MENFDTVRLRKDGTSALVSLTLSPITHAEGRIIGVSKIARDITESKRAEEHLRESEARMRLAHLAAGIGTFEWHVPENRLAWSPELCALYGLTADRFGGNYESWLERLHPEDVHTASAMVESALATGEYEHDFRVIWPDASMRWLDARARVVFDEVGRPLRMIGVNVDITERKRAEQALRASEERFRVAQELPGKCLGEACD